MEGGPLVRIMGCDARLQLSAVKGKACARLYIKKTFHDWKSVFYNSWVGFYRLPYNKSDYYDTYQYAVKFTKIGTTATDDYDIYQYRSSLTIAPDVQIRFLLDKKYDNVLAQTVPWERDEEETPACSFPEFLYEPELYDANNVVPVKIDSYDAGLQLFTKDGKACAQIYIKKTFKNWKDTFRYSWVGFYTSSQSKNNKYDTFQYATKFGAKVG
ncbi:uncharacterized protein LOC122331589 [Puntigrus tetrazona]|uniref:uncharacterized protein LOC122331589 n=1 Tax=Puntigrus tetrazona TaxID=1606681 RepID=UPI001C8A12D5|nr:uncharacterized protein LOC122331589 [Puntigrus tetrazona]XP_043085078.1 uncharacterized protein LOC122331589 [Puntigrus tetrazona]